MNNQIRDIGNQFVKDFLSVHRYAVQLKSKEPALCWKASGAVSFACISEFSGTDTTSADAPELYRLRTNLSPPPALFYQLRSSSFRANLGLVPNPLIATDPVLELTAKPDEICKFGSWLTDWLDSHFYQRSNPPSPPIPLISCNWTEDLATKKEDLTKVGRDWTNHLYLWTPAALSSFETWVYK